METPSQPVRRVVVNTQSNSATPSGRMGSAPSVGRPAPQVAKPSGGMLGRLLDFVVTTSLMAIFFGLPIFFLGLTFQGIAFEKQVYFYFWILLALIAWAVKGVISGEMRVRRTPLDLPILIFWVVYVLATVFSVDRWHSFWGFFGDPSRGLMSVTTLILGYYLLVSHFTVSRMKKIIGAILCSGIVVSVWSAIALFSNAAVINKLLRFVPLSPIGSLSGLGMMLSFIIPIAVVVIFKVGENQSGSRALRVAILTVLILLLLLDLFLLYALFSFVPWVGLLVGIGIFLIYILSQIVRPSHTWSWVPMVAFVIILGFLMVKGSTIVKKQLPVEVSPSYQLSWDIAKGSLKSGFGKFFIGSGPATYGYDFSAFKPQEFNLNNLYTLRFYQGTGMFFEYLATIGAIGTIAFLMLILTFVGSTAYLLSKEKEKNKIYSLGILTASFIVLMDGLLGRIEGAVLILGVMLAALAVATVLQESDAEERFLNLSLKASPKFALTLAFVFIVASAGVVFLFIFLGKVLTADLYLGAAARESKVTEQGVGKILSGIDLYGKEGRYYTQLGQAYMVLANSEMLKGESARDVNRIKAYLNGSVQASEAGATLMPRDAATIESLAYIYENAGYYVPDSFNNAEKNYRKALELESQNPTYLLKLGQIKVNQALGQKDEGEKKKAVEEAKNLFQQSVDKKANFDAGLYNLSLTQEALGDLDGAIASLTKAVSISQNNVNYLFNLGRLFMNRGKDTDNVQAENLFKAVLSINDREVNSHFYLGLLDEKMDKKTEAITEYKRVLELLPPNSDKTKEKINSMIDNLNKGVKNITDKGLEQVQSVDQITQ